MKMALFLVVAAIASFRLVESRPSSVYEKAIRDALSKIKFSEPREDSSARRRRQEEGGYGEILPGELPFPGVGPVPGVLPGQLPGPMIAPTAGPAPIQLKYPLEVDISPLTELMESTFASLEGKIAYLTNTMERVKEVLIEKTEEINNNGVNPIDPINPPAIIDEPEIIPEYEEAVGV